VVNDVLPRLRKLAPQGVTYQTVQDRTRSEDGILHIEVQLPDAASIERVEETTKHIERILSSMSGVEGVLSVADEPPVGWLYIRVKDVDAARTAIRKRLHAEIHEAAVRVLDGRTQHLPPDRRTDVSLIILDDGDHGQNDLQKQTDQLEAELRKDSHLVDVWTDLRANVPELSYELDRRKLADLGIPLSEVFNTFQAAVGGITEINGIVVRLRPKGRERATPETLQKIMLPAGREGVPLGKVVNVQTLSGPLKIAHYQGKRSALIGADLAHGAAVEEARKECREAVKRLGLPKGFRVLLSGTAMDKPEDITP